MAKQFLLAFFITSVHSAAAQFTVNIQWLDVTPSKTSDTIYYDSGVKLTWNDFRGKPDEVSKAGAITESGFGYRMNMNSRNNRTSVNISVYCYFNKNKSWVKKGMKTAYALLHEQHHYDITYINTCLFIMKLKKANLNKSNYAVVVEQIYNECFTALNTMQDEYDGETSNGRIESMQQVWNKKIDAQLATYTTN